MSYTPAPPSNDPPPQGLFTPELEIDGPGPQSRLTVAFRAILAIPQFIALFFLGIAQAVVLFVSWFAALFLGRLPDWSQRFLSGYLAYAVRVNAYMYLLVDRYPPFSFEVTDYPARIELRPGRLNRLGVLFRLILAIPASIVAGVLNWGWSVCAFFLWLAVLISGRSPEPVFGATAAVLRYAVRLQAYMSLLTSAYPKKVFGEPATEQPATTRGTRPLVLTSGGRRLLIVFIVVGVLGLLGNIVGNIVLQSQLGNQHSPHHVSLVVPR